jgi:hypothetical protein
VKRKEYIERNGLHSDKKPHEMAAEIGGQQKKQLRAWKKFNKKKKRKKARNGYFGQE